MVPLYLVMNDRWLWSAPGLLCSEMIFPELLALTWRALLLDVYRCVRQAVAREVRSPTTQYLRTRDVQTSLPPM
jgi:hypothetical protein